MAKLGLAILILFCIELAVIVQVGSVIGPFMVIVLLFISAGYGVSLVRTQGLRTLMNMQQQLAVGETPAQSMLEGLMLLLCGLLFIFPGFLTDILALVLVQKFVRGKLAGTLLKSGRWRVVGQGPFQGFGGHGFGGDFKSSQQDQQGTTVDGEYERKDQHSDHSDDHRLH